MNKISLINPLTQLFQLQLTNNLPDHAFNLICLILFRIQHPVIITYQLIQFMLQQYNIHELYLIGVFN